MRSQVLNTGEVQLGLNFNLERGTASAYAAGDAIDRARMYAKAKGAISGRLLTYAEARSLKTIADANTSGLVYRMLWGKENTGDRLYYWLGSVGSVGAQTVWKVDGYNRTLVGNTAFYSSGETGVRPVLTVLKSQIS